MSTASKKKISKKLVLKILASVVLVGGTTAYYLLSKSNEGEVLSWMSSSWAYRRGISVGNSEATELTNEDVLIELDTASLISAGKMQNDCDDLRVTDSDTTTAINYWIEAGCNTANTQIWVRVPTLPSEGKTIYLYYGNETAVNAQETWGGNLSLIYNTDCPTGWTRNDDLDDNIFLYGSATYGTTDGTSSHNHGTASCTTSSISGQTQCSTGTDRTHILATHTHTGLSVTVDTETVLPPYLDVVICKKNDENIIAEANMITLFDDSLPAGWNNFSALNSKFPRGATSYGGTGGVTTHTHTYTAGATTSSASSDYRNTEYFTPTHSSLGGHTHTSASATVSSPSNIPPYLTINFGQTSAQTYLPSNSIITTNVLPPLGWTRYSSLDTRLPYGSTTPGTTGGTSSHTHSVTITSSGPSVGANLCGAGNEFYCALSTHTHTCTVETSSQSNYPPYMTVIFAQRKESETTTVSEEESYNQNPYEPETLYCEGESLPYGLTDTTPEFSAIFSDPNTLDTGEYYEIEVNTSPSFDGTSMWDSGKTSISSITNSNRSSDISYNGTSLSTNGATYYWRVRFWDNNDGVSMWSQVHRFRMSDSGFTAENIVIGGAFETIYEESTIASGIAYWNGSTWKSHEAGFNNTVYDIAEDSKGNIYAVGAFTKAGGNDANRIAMWDGDSWEVLGTGLNSVAYSIEIDSSDNVYVGGAFTTAGGSTVNRIAMWDGSSWSTFGTGLGNTVYSLSLDSSSGDIYVGGSFTTAGGSTANRIAKWNGSSWSTFGTGFSNTVYTIEFDSSTSIYVGGYFTDGGGNSYADGIAMWDGDSWEALGTGTNSYATVYDIKLDSSGNVYAAGNFYQMGGSYIYRFAKWNGSSWSALGGDGYMFGASTIESIFIDGNDNIYVAGEFTTEQSGLSNNIAYWDGDSWENISYGTNNPLEVVFKDSSNNIYVGGNLTGTANSYSSMNYISRWDGNSWHSYGTGMNNIVYDVESDSSGNIYAAGSFTIAGGSSANRIAYWDGNSWEALGSGLNSTVYDIAIDSSGNIYAVGSFTTAGGSSATRVAKWNGSSWSTFGSGFALTPYAVDVDSSGNVYVGGPFNDGGGNTNADKIAMWDGDSWEALGTGLSGTVYDIEIDSNDYVFVGGSFTDAGGNTNADGIAYWDGDSWEALGTGVTNYPKSMFIDSSNNLYAGGYLFTAGGVSVDRVIKWNGSAWSDLGDLDALTSESVELSPSGYLYAGGEYANEFTPKSKRIVYYKGTSWYTLNDQAPFEDVKTIYTLGTNTAPTAPTSLYAEGTTNPPKVTDTTPEFSAIFNDTDSGNTGSYYQILVNTSSDFTGTEMWDSGKTAMPNQPANGNRCDDISYAGTSLTIDGSQYYWKIKFWDNVGAESQWSSTANFVMGGPPIASSLLTDNQSNPTLLNSASPVFSAICTDPNGDNCSAYQINVNSTPSFDGTELWDTGKTSTTITSGNRSSDFTYHGTPLTNSQNIYYWRIKFWDSDDNEGSWSSTAQFTDFYPSFKFEGIKLEGITIN